MFAKNTIASRTLRACRRLEPERGFLPPLMAMDGARRKLNLHEHASMEVIREHGIETPRGYLASDPDEAEALFRRHFAMARGNKPETQNGKHQEQKREAFHQAVIKAQVLSGGRKHGRFLTNGFEGGVHLVSNPGEARAIAEKMLGQRLATRQAPEGVPCQSVLLVERLRLKREMYVAILLDRSSQGPLLIGSAFGGGSSKTSVLDVARSHPGSVFTEHIDAEDGLERDQCERMAENIGLDPGTESFGRAVALMGDLYELFVAKDCTLIEVNPLAETEAVEDGGSSPGGNNNNNNIVVVDARIQFDDHAWFRQAGVFARRDWDQEDPREAEALGSGIDYIGLDGNIGCVVNGAGLAMATMDLVQAMGGSPSSFLDVGRGAAVAESMAAQAPAASASGEDDTDVGTTTTVARAFSILDSDPAVRVILVNIFGGILRCDVIANEIVSLSKTLRKPLVVRLQGTNYGAARDLIARHNEEQQSDSNSGNHATSRGTTIVLEDDLETAVALAVSIAETGSIDGACAERPKTRQEERNNNDEDDEDDQRANEAGPEAVTTGSTTKQEIPRFEGFTL